MSQRSEEEEVILPMSNIASYSEATDKQLQYELDFCHHMIKLIKCSAAPEEHYPLYNKRIFNAEMELERRLLS
jgi:hypothetical protein